MEVHTYTHSASGATRKKRTYYFPGFVILLFAVFMQTAIDAQKSRARDIGIPFDGTPGKFNAITDVKGVEVGYSTIISG